MRFTWIIAFRYLVEVAFLAFVFWALAVTAEGNEYSKAHTLGWEVLLIPSVVGAFAIIALVESAVKAASRESAAKHPSFRQDSP